MTSKTDLMLRALRHLLQHEGWRHPSPQTDALMREIDEALKEDEDEEDTWETKATAESELLGSESGPSGNTSS